MRLKRILTLLLPMFFVVPLAYAQYPYSMLIPAQNKKVLPPSMYNNEHQQHITKNDPDFINDLSLDNTEFGATKDPYAGE